MNALLPARLRSDITRDRDRLTSAIQALELGDVQKTIGLLDAAREITEIQLGLPDHLGIHPGLGPGVNVLDLEFCGIVWIDEDGVPHLCAREDQLDKAHDGPCACHCGARHVEVRA